MPASQPLPGYVVSCVLAWAAVSAQEIEPASTRGVRLGALESASGRGGVLDWVLELVPAGRDDFRSESIHDKIKPRLKKWVEAITQGRDAAGSALLDPEFRGAPPRPDLPRAHEAGGLRVWKWKSRNANANAETEKMADAVAFVGGWRRALGWLGSRPRVEIKVVSVRIARETASAGVLIEASGRKGGDHRQLRAVWQTDWKRAPATTAAGMRWRLTRCVPRDYSRAAMARRPFTDVTNVAFGREASFRKQLSRGVEYWRRHLDSATGIDLYGHQGLAVGDLDGDGWEDLYVAQPAGLPNRLFQNRGDGTFADVTASAGLDVLDNTGGVLLVDLDGDAQLDVVVTTGLEVLIFENLGRLRFRRREKTGLEKTSRRGATAMGCSGADYDGDGDVDLYVYSYIFWAGTGSRSHSSYPYPYHDANNGAPNYLFRNEGKFHFADETGPSGMDENNRRFSLAASWCDYDGDGLPDLYVANDFGKNNLYRNLGNGVFKDVAQDAGVEDTGNGMSVTWEDVNGDGRMDLYVGNMWSSAGNRLVTQAGFGSIGKELRDLYLRMSRGNSLFVNRGDGSFADVVTEARFGRWAWCCRFIDFDADGRRDLYVANGFLSNRDRKDL